MKCYIFAENQCEYDAFTVQPLRAVLWLPTSPCTGEALVRCNNIVFQPSQIPPFGGIFPYSNTSSIDCRIFSSRPGAKGLSSPTDSAKYTM